MKQKTKQKNFLENKTNIIEPTIGKKENGTVIDEDVITKEEKTGIQQKYNAVVSNQTKEKESIELNHNNGIEYNPDILIFELTSKIKKLEAEKQKSLSFDLLNSFLLNEKRTNIYIDGLYDRFLAHFKPVESK